MKIVNSNITNMEVKVLTIIIILAQSVKNGQAKVSPMLEITLQKMQIHS